MSIFEVIGIIVVILFIAYLLLFLLYRRVATDIPPAVALDAMPVLRPKPIPTKHRKSFIGKLLVAIYEVRRWEVIAHWYHKLPDGTEIIIPQGFDFDGASIPRPFWALLSPIGLLLIPGLIHDYGYKYDQLWRLDADGNVMAYNKDAGKDYWDKLFLEVGEQVNGFSLINGIAWLAVSIGGKGGWRKHRKTGAIPEKPTL